MQIVQYNTWSNPVDWLGVNVSMEARYLYQILRLLEPSVEIAPCELSEDIGITVPKLNRLLGELAEHDYVYRTKIGETLYIILGSERHSAKYVHKQYLKLFEDIPQ